MENLQKQCKEPMMNISFVIMITNVLNLVTGLLMPYADNKASLEQEQLEKLVVFAIAWAVGGVYEFHDRQIVHEFLYTKGAKIPAKNDKETIFDYFLNDAI